MSEFRKLKDLDDDELEDVITSVNRERARRSQRPPSEMSDPEYRRWVDDEITKAQRARAKAAEAAKEQ